MIHLYCGDGKGKTTAAAGLAVRAAGRDKRVIFAGFMKGRSSGEIEIFRKIPSITVLRGEFSRKFTFEMSEEERRQEAEKNAELLERAFSSAFSQGAGLLILDEAATAASCGMISGERLKELTEKYRDTFEIVITGRNPPDDIAESADYVTKMEKVKHPYDSGTAARKGIEY